MKRKSALALAVGESLLILLMFSVGPRVAMGSLAIQDKVLDGKALIAAAQKNNMELAQSAIDAGVDVNFKNDYGATALFFACDRGNEAMVKLLLEHDADPNVKDRFYNATPLTWAQSKNERKIMMMLFAAGGDGAVEYLLQAVMKNDDAAVKELINNKCVDQAGLMKIRKIVSLQKDEIKSKMMPIFDASCETEFVAPKALDAQLVQKLIGQYKSDRFGVEVSEKTGKLFLKVANGFPAPLQSLGDNEFMASGNLSSFEFDNDGKVTAFVGNFGGREIKFFPASDKDEAKPQTGVATADPKMNPSDNVDNDSDDPKTPETFVSKDMDVSSPRWASFRGVGSRGIADGQNAPLKWSVDEANSKNIKWKTPVPGLGMSCPTIWDDRVFVTTAVAEGDQEAIKIGLYGDVASVEDDREYQFKVVCLSKSSGEILWEKVANQAKPMVKRHAKSSHANPTVATNGERLVAFFGSEGLYCYDLDGNLKWKKDFGFLDSGWFYDPGYQWGFGSSPIIFEDRVIVQCDIQGQSFLAAMNLENGEEIWRTDRDEIPTWSTPTVHTFKDVTMVITNGTKAARGYDVKDGAELWSLKGHSEIVVPTPSVAHELIFLSSGYSPIQPIYAIRPSARGDLSLPSNETSSESIQWSQKRGGPYMPTPIVYGDYLYCCANAGILSCHNAKTGKQIYRKRMKAPGGSLSFTASPIAADGHLFLTAEDGRVLVVKAGPKFELVDTNTLGESVLATPAISEGSIFFRGQNHVIAVGGK